MAPSTSALNLTPTSTGLVSCSSTLSGVTLGPAIMHGHPTLTLTLGADDSTLPVSSVARAMIVERGEPWAIQL